LADPENHTLELKITTLSYTYRRLELSQACGSTALC